MITAKHKQDRFMREFQELLERHNTDFKIIDCDGFYSSGYIQVTIPAKYDDDFNLVEEYTDFTINNYDI